MALASLVKVAKPLLVEEFGEIDFTIDHTFSSEIDPSKREFLRDMVKPSALFGDVKTLCQDTALDFANDLAGVDTPMDPFPAAADGYLDGFPRKETLGSACLLTTLDSSLFSSPFHLPPLTHP
eukprot:99515-Pyramimonas_sp.AAC.1